MKYLPRLFAALGLLASSAAWAQFGNGRPNSGACFYTDINFRGQSFCMNAGQDASTMPSGFNDRIRSIRVFGRTQVTFFNDSLFRGVSGSTSRDIPDLRQYPLPDVPSKNWTTRISSVRVGGGFGDGYPGGRDYHDRDRDGERDHDRYNDVDRDRDQDRDHDADRDHDRDGWHGNTVSCHSDSDRDREWCKTSSRVNNVRLVNQNGRCEYGRTFGVDNGRLWTSHGCAGSFEVR
jgi:hypothetical protein